MKNKRRCDTSEIETRELICIGCPLGCPLTVEMKGTEVVSVTGNTCPNGDRYARKEVTDPRRTVTSTVRVLGGSLPVVSVKTAQDIPKNKIFDCMQELATIRVKAPVQEGDVIVSNIANTGVSVIATKEIPTE